MNRYLTILVGRGLAGALALLMCMNDSDYLPSNRPYARLSKKAKNRFQRSVTNQRPRRTKRAIKITDLLKPNNLFQINNGKIERSLEGWKEA